MSYTLPVIVLILASAGTLVFSTLTYALREYARTSVQDLLEASGRGRWYQPTVDRTDDLIFTTAIGRLLCNLVILICVLDLIRAEHHPDWLTYLLAVAATALITMVLSVAVPHALSSYAADRIVAASAPLLHGWRTALLPATRLLHGVDYLAQRLFVSTPDNEKEQIEAEILSAVEDGEKEGLVDEQEREMIESVIQFRSTTVGQAMTARPEIVALPVDATLAEVRQLIEESGHSRLPVYEGSLDQILGILYARDLLKFVGTPADRFNIRSAMRPAFYVQETRSLKDLLSDFRTQKVHMAIVLDEYGGTAGLVTIEDVLEEIVGDISDEHEPIGQEMLRRIDDATAEVDARMYIDQCNRLLGLNLPEDAGFDTLGGFVSNMLGRIPKTGTMFESHGARFTVLDAEPQKVNRLRIELIPARQEPDAA
jgi:CBS domain containing-hemolysin-like protein